MSKQLVSSSCMSRLNVLVFHCFLKVAFDCHFYLPAHMCQVWTDNNSNSVYFILFYLQNYIQDHTHSNILCKIYNIQYACSPSPSLSNSQYATCLVTTRRMRSLVKGHSHYTKYSADVTQSVCTDGCLISDHNYDSITDSVW